MASSTEVDVLVAGGGMAGLVAAVSAVESGARVLMVERGDAPGGSMALSVGSIGAFDYAAIRELIPNGDAELQRTLVEGVRPGWAWLESLGVELTPETARRTGRSGRSMRPPQFIDTMVGLLRARGAELLTATSLIDVAPASGGWSVQLQSDGRGARTVACRSLVLATGGFQNSPALVREYLGLDPEHLWERNSGRSDGTGLRLALALGGATAGAMDTFYGHCLPAPPARFGKEDFFHLTQYYGPWCAAINRRGERYTDESASEFEEALAQDTARQPDSFAFYVFDQAVYRERVCNILNPGFPPGRPWPDRLQAARAVGGPVCEADTLAALAEQMAAWGVAGPTARATLEEYDRACREGWVERLPVPRRRFAQPLAQPPYVAVGVQPGLTFTMGGIRVDPRARVLDRAGQPIPGLYAGGSDIGNVSNRYYAGGLPTALVFGRIAGREAAVGCSQSLR